MKLLWAEFKSHQAAIVTLLCGLLLLVQFSNLLTYVALNTDNQAVIIAQDDDAGWGIMKTVKTRWWKDNGWAHYGPAYFRTTHSLNYYLGKTAAPALERENENWERTAHFSIMLVSLLSVYGSMLFLASILTASWAHRFALATLLVAAALSDQAWAKFILVAHPDHLFALVCAGAFYWTLRWLSERENQKYFVGSALLWGLAVATKLSVALVGPAFALLFVPPLNRSRLLEGLKYLGYMFLGYFVIGFPQTIVLDRPFRFLFQQGKLSFPADGESLKAWLTLFGEQSWRILLLLVIFALLVPASQKVLKLKRGDWIRLVLILLFPFAMMLKRKLTIPFTHYPFPFLMMGFVLTAVALARVRRMAWTANPWTALLPLAVMLVSVGATPAMLQTKLVNQHKCRSENRVLHAKMIEWGAEGRKIWLDPYVPYDTTLPSSRQDVGWGKSWQQAEAEGYDLMALERGFYQQFLGEISNYTRVETPGWMAAREFYQSFADKTEAVSPSGRKFFKVYSDACSHEIWKRQD